MRPTSSKLAEHLGPKRSASPYLQARICFAVRSVFPFRPHKVNKFPFRIEIHEKEILDTSVEIYRVNCRLLLQSELAPTSEFISFGRSGVCLAL